MTDPAPPTVRIEVVDVLRGAAMFGILTVNVWFFASAGINVGEPDFGSTVDLAGYGLATLLFASKSYLLFAFLFGYSFVLQSGPGFPHRMRRRMVGLIVLGLVHGLLLFPGDILVTYGLLGFLLIAMRSLSAEAATRRGFRLTLATGAVLILLGLLLCAAGGLGEVADNGAAEELRRAYTGSVTDILGVHAMLYPTSLFFVLLVQGPPALGAMLVGMAAARRGLLGDPPGLAGVWRRLSPWAPVLGAVGAVAFTALTLSGGFAPALLGLGVTILTAPFLTATYVALVVRWHRGNPGGRLQHGVAAVGRLALSNYLAQSLVMLLIFSGFGLGLMGRLGSWQVWGVVLGIYAVQVTVSAWWVKRHRRGPAELLLRKWTR